MGKLAVIATIEFTPGSDAAVLAALRAHRDRCLASEPGTLMFEIMAPREGAGTFMLYEVYRDQAAFDAHWNGPSLAMCRAETEGRMTIASGLWGTPVD